MKTEALEPKKGWSSLQRPRYSAGLLLEDGDLTAAVDYTRDMIRLLMRSLFGCGVVCGLKVTAALDCGRKLKVSVAQGLAFDGAGNPIHVPSTEVVTHDFDCCDIPEKVWVSICYTDKPCRPKDVSCSDDEDSRREHTRIRDGYEIRLHTEFPTSSCGCGKGPTTPAKTKKGGCCQDEGEKAAAAAAPAAAGAAAPAPAQAPATAAPAATAPTVLGEGCDCYADHLNNVCSCDCTSKCVYLAEITLWSNDENKPIDPAALQADDAGRRSVRPMLLGLYQCLQPPVDDGEEGNDGGEVKPNVKQPEAPADPG
jgi:hypothetical protein